uniref:Uncharacterized protein n=1 Tax=Rhizophora mucronata TaxID=61149 RepID=A0A2P2J320_RHIMU
MTRLGARRRKNLLELSPENARVEQVKMENVNLGVDSREEKVEQKDSGRNQGRGLN